ncbi:MAG TPA: carboxylating nicotinate-nucleotide diphosphorylase [Cryomorphaceae bacterium]|nr:nicotinate-nucleotide diphosphorylase (carboxylating) [Owenweeksia sp.]MBF98478.1 nicotinate-nucleotide diphosphorylase (carboxylating) [Owenweeksia sp.]HAD96961.1 carboxylating nicotinate-nucleotide diphosphorylase [Cryomorphaceae bacterium]HBF20965.1 carboxylating nicotinate-nucleotide diphosphorylase [Cryomorphaceae bacterium]|tara:strand:+ start:1237 stop:2085 length:849 start_codon:yes stop_codon:yes gene_type:complete
MLEFRDYLNDFIEKAIAEDVGNGDHSSNCCIPASARGAVQLLVKENGVIAGLEIAREIFRKVDPSVDVQLLLQDGVKVRHGDIALRAEGPERSLLRGERLALNVLQRMSGIATQTAKMAELIKGTRAIILDTRKTTPNLRFLEKMAVRMGGGQNHRMGLYDMIMLKDNHIDFAGGIKPAIEKARIYMAEKGLTIPIEVETRNMNELKEVLDTGGVDRVMFDNFTVEETYKAVELVNRKLETESSGGITEKTIRAYAETGVDFISVGALTHSVKSLDLSLKAI